MRLPRFVHVRIAVLLLVLTGAGVSSAYQSAQSRSWEQTLQVTVYPINADGHRATERYINSLNNRHFEDINRWSRREARRHKLPLEQPIQVVRGATINDRPPTMPENSNAANTILWSLRFRWWAYLNTPDSDNDLTRVRMFVMYHRGRPGKPLPESLGMEKGLLGLVHAYSSHDQTAQNNIVITHELLHTVGAIDKYDAYGVPSYPNGYANSQRRPLFPQRNAEIMAGRIPTSLSSSYMAESLRSVVINDLTAAEINWLQ